LIVYNSCKKWRKECVYRKCECEKLGAVNNMVVKTCSISSPADQVTGGVLMGFAIMAAFIGLWVVAFILGASAIGFLCLRTDRVRWKCNACGKKLSPMTAEYFQQVWTYQEENTNIR